MTDVEPTKFMLKNLEDDEIVHVVITTFSGNSKEIATVGGVLNKGTKDAFETNLAEEGVGWETLKEFRVQTFEGHGKAYGRSRKGQTFKPIEWDPEEDSS
jgi:hypothetical protein